MGDVIVIEGGTPLCGDIFISGAKNAALPIMTASLLSAEKLVLDNIPQLSDIDTMISVLRHYGVEINCLKNSLRLRADKVMNFEAPHTLMNEIRASIWVLGPLLTRFGEAKVFLPGGCAIGARHVDLHVEVLRSFGAEVRIDRGYIVAKSHGKLRGTRFDFDKISVGATINAILAAVLADGSTQLRNCAKEPEIVDLCACLVKMGARIRDAGSGIINIDGVVALTSANHRVIFDRIEAGTYMIAAAITNGAVRFHNVDMEHLEPLISALQSSGVVIRVHSSTISIEPSKAAITAVNVETKAYPGFSTDFQAQFMALMSVANGTSIIRENIFEKRFMHVRELVKMGANINIEGRNAVVRGVENLRGAENIQARDLRGAASLVIAALSATGVSRIHGAHHLDRGYEFLLEKLKRCGAKIKRISGG